MVIDVADELFSNGFTCRLMLLDEPKRIVKILNRQDSSAFSVPRQIRQVADDAYKFRDEVGGMAKLGCDFIKSLLHQAIW